MPSRVQILVAVTDCITNHALSRASADNSVERVIEWYVRMNGEGPYRLYDVLAANPTKDYVTWLPRVLTLTRVGETITTGGDGTTKVTWKRVRPPRK